jgi:exopolyphosphatase/guanosine-5'-triphosphate,3'-diphosphate pyrophosphatase
MVVAHKGNLRKVSEMLQEPDVAKAVVAFRLAVLFMHSRIDIDFTMIRLRMKSRIELEIPREWVADHPTLSYWLEKEQEHWDDVGADFIIRTAG